MVLTGATSPEKVVFGSGHTEISASGAASIKYSKNYENNGFIVGESESDLHNEIINDDSTNLSFLNIEKDESSRVLETGNKKQLYATFTDESSRVLATGKGRQLYATFAATIGSAALGTVLSWTATALPDLRKTDKFKVGPEEELWIGPIALLGAVASCPVVGISIEKLGRRKSMLCLTLPFLAGCFLMAFAQNISMIYAGRFITGFCGGAFSIIIPVFITEIAHVSIRGCLASGFDMMITVGILYIFLIGTYATWESQALACGALAILWHILLIFVPESPRFLIEIGKQNEASKALCWFRNVSSSQQVEEELEDLTRSVDESKRKSTKWRDLLSISVVKPTSIGLALMWFQQVSAIDAIMFYTVDIFHSAGSAIDENLSTNIVGGIQVIATIVSASLVDRLGRRFLLLFSEIFMVISLGTLGLFFHLKEHGESEISSHLSWLPLSSLMVFVVAFSVGFGPIPWLIMGEMLPPQVKGVASGLITSSRWILGFVVTLAFKDIINILGENGAYWFFSAMSFLGIFYVYFYVPETKGKTLDEIQLLFNPISPIKCEIDIEKKPNIQEETVM